MLFEVILGEGDKLVWGESFWAGKDLGVDVRRKMLDANGTEAGLGGDWQASVYSERICMAVRTDCLDFSLWRHCFWWRRSISVAGD